ncbi:glycerophosphodiester phosphodiesterase family protein [Paenibacillus alba]|uniref:glycerophosphodiester phosphodiesterase family protein n=1 Tax=Paenibacillus alba TaxID=1197127 RepID=UPI0015672676|nr:glycerophosphodiester phosphodiesterase family protein [Paenibacillus alba]
MKKMSTKLLGIVTITTLVSGLFQPSAWVPSVHAEESGRKMMEVNKTLTAPIIDGNLDESMWNLNQTLNVKVGQGSFKASKFGLLWDNQYLYIGVKADDDSLLTGQSGSWFEQDNINVFLDPSLHRSAPYSNEDMQIGLVYQPGTTIPEFHFGAALNNHAGKDEKKILRAMNQTASGWSTEIAVPWEMLKFDPILQKQLGMEIGTTDRYGAATTEQRSSYWSAFGSSSFWNDTSGYGTLKLVDTSPVSGSPNPVLLEENFDGYATGTIPPNWISNVNEGSPSFTVVKDTYGNGSMTFDGNAKSKQSRILAPVQWDNYTIEADVRFSGFLDPGRWASIMFRAPASGKPPYPQMAIKQNGTIETAYRNSDGNWYSPTPISATGAGLLVNKDYTMKVRVYDNNVKQYFKAKSDTSFTLYGDKNLAAAVLPEKGRVGFQGDQSKVSFDNLKVTRITAERLTITSVSSLEALSGATSVTSSVYYSDGLTETPPADRVKLYSSDESVIKINNNQIYPIKPGKATIKAVYGNAETSQEITVTPSLTGVKVVSLKGDDKGYVLATVGTSLDLSAVKFQADYNNLTTGTVNGNELTWTSTSPLVLIENNVPKVQQKGVYTLTGTKDSASISMLVVAKNAADTDYVLYEENFDHLADGTLPAGWTRKEGTTAANAVVKSGAFEINALAAPDNPSRVILPSFLSKFGNYKIEADVTHLQATDTARWHSIMYRIQNNDYPYYQMAVRKDATAANGIEFAERTPANGWNVIDRGSNTEAIDPAKMYHYTVKAYGNRVQEWINDRVMVDTDQATVYATGAVGLQANGSKMKVDNIRVTLQQEALPPIPNGRFVEVTEPETRIAMAASVVSELQSAADLAKLDAPALPSNLIIHVAPGLKVTDSAGKLEIGSLDTLLSKIDGRIIPAFYVKDESTVDQLVAYLKTNSWEDAAIVSDNGELIKRARTAYPIIRGILDFSGDSSLKASQLLDVRRKTAASLARIAILPQAISTRENVAYLQQRSIMVWSKETASASEKQIAMHQLIATGVNGIVTDSPAVQWAALKVYNKNTTLIRKPYIIAHRGMPANSPENTIESNRLGLEAGAEFIENDMYLTKDGHIVILHDGSLERTTNGTGFVEDYTLEQLKKLNANKPYPEGFPDVKIPTLNEQIELAREKGAMVMSEIKTSTPTAVDAYVKLLKDIDGEALVDTMSFSADQLKRMAQLMPEMPLGLLTSGYANEANVPKSLRETLKLLQGLNASFNTSYSGLGQKFMEAAKHRGLIISPWTLNDKSAFMQYMGLGAFGITTDYAYYASDWAASIKAEKEKYVLAKEESATLAAVVQSYKGTKSTIVPELVFLDGQELVALDGAKVTAKKSGTAHVLLRYTTAMDDRNKYDIYTAPISIQIPGQDGEGGGDDGNGGSATGSSVTGGSPTLPATPAAAVIEAKEGKVAALELKQSLGAHSKVEVKFSGASLELEAAGLIESSKLTGQTLLASSENVSYTLPLSALKLDELAKQLGVNMDDLRIRFTLKKLDGQDASVVDQAISAAGGKPMTAAVHFEVEAANQAGQTAPVTLGATYASRTILLDKAIDPKKATGVQVIPGTNRLRFVPTLFVTKDGKTTATLIHNQNGVFTIVENHKSFSDLTNHWAKADIELLANKLVVDGVSDSRFEADRSITRAEFAALLVRSLGLSMEASKTTSFKDVAASDWFADVAGSAASAGLLSGYEDGTFRPNQEITREEQAAMVVRAMSFVGIDTRVSSAKRDETLASFQDADQIIWAQSEMAAAIQLGLMNGMAADTLASSSYATRAQSVVMLKRLLVKANFLNE